MTPFFHSKWKLSTDFSPIYPANILISMCKQMVDLRLEERGNSIKVTFTCWLGKADVLRVSCISSAGFLLGMLRINAA